MEKKIHSISGTNAQCCSLCKTVTITLENVNTRIMFPCRFVRLQSTKMLFSASSAHHEVYKRSVVNMHVCMAEG